MVGGPAGSAGNDARKPLKTGVHEQVDVYLVEMSILATNKKGEPITDLRPDEVLVKERKKPQEIAFFERHLREPPEGPVPEGRIHFNAPDGRQPRSGNGVEPRWFFFYFDLVHGSMLVRDQLREAARLKAQALGVGYVELRETNSSPDVVGWGTRSNKVIMRLALPESIEDIDQY